MLWVLGLGSGFLQPLSNEAGRWWSPWPVGLSLPTPHSWLGLDFGSWYPGLAWRLDAGSVLLVPAFCLCSIPRLVPWAQELSWLQSTLCTDPSGVTGHI